MDQYGCPRADVLYSSPLPGGVVHLTRVGVLYQVHAPLRWLEEEKPGYGEKVSYPAEVGVHRVEMYWIGGQPQQIEPHKPLPDYEHFYTQDEPALFVYSYRQVWYRQVWPGVDMVFQEREGQLVFDLHVAPGVDVGVVQFRVEGTMPRVEGEELVLPTVYGEVRIAAPKAWADGRAVPVYWQVEGDRVRLEVQQRLLSEALFIDPGIRLWGTYYGAQSSPVQGQVDASPAYGVCSYGSVVYMVGSTTLSTNIATSGAHQTILGGLRSAYLASMDAATGLRNWATYYGGSGGSAVTDGRGCAVDGSGNVYLTGYTGATSGIASSGAHQTTLGGGQDAFLAKFNSVGVRQWGTYYGGGGTDGAYRCAVDGTGNVYMSGYTNSPSNIAASGFQNSLGGGQDAFLIKFNAGGTRQWGTYYGGPSNDNGYACAVSPGGNVCLVGSTTSTSGIASSGSHQSSFAGGGGDAFIVYFTGSGVRSWATYYGGPGSDEASAVDIDGAENVYVVGTTNSSSGIASGGFQNTIGGSSDLFLVKFSVLGSRLWGTYYGGAGYDEGKGCKVSANGHIYVAGSANSSPPGLATPGVQQTSCSGVCALLGKFDANGGRVWATYYGAWGGYGTYGRDVATFPGGAYLVGYTDYYTTTAPNLIGTPGTHNPTAPGECTKNPVIEVSVCPNFGFLAKFCGDSWSSGVCTPLAYRGGQGGYGSTNQEEWGVEVRSSERVEVWASRPCVLEVWDVSGRLIAQWAIEAGERRVEALPGSGLYFVRETNGIQSLRILVP